jgi:hypothetical protein
MTPFLRIFGVDEIMTSNYSLSKPLCKGAVIFLIVLIPINPYQSEQDLNLL